MVLTHQTSHTYAHPFPTVTLAYYLRYTSSQLNPFASHVLSTDTLESRVDAKTGRLHTTRIHLKKSRLPGAIFKLLPSTLTGGNSGGHDRASYILETTTVDIKQGWMKTESKNINWTGVLSVVEKQKYFIPSALDANNEGSDSTTDVTTTVVFRCRLGEKLRGKRDELLEKGNQGWLGWVAGGWGAKGVQKTIESLASTKTMDQLGKSREGMRVVLERLRHSGGVMALLEQKRRENMLAEKAA
ncbi:msf1 domain containing protein [Zalerion maritima]|uniref:Msf1 domain containing protein n=1 Tax=Zalerion maritima TaxID=339359 RepID=A0AAD5RM51_9PEZI|nr:msf1 domain containing protein [Zalerion maritima]